MMLLGEDREETGFEADEQRRSNLEQLEPLFRLDAEGVQRAAWELAGDTPFLDAGEIFLGGLNQAFVAARLGMDQEAVAANWPTLKTAYAWAAYGSDPQTEEEFKGLAAEEMTQWRRAEDARTFESIYAGASNGVVLPVEKPPQWWMPDGGVEEKLAGANRAYFSFLQGKELDDQGYTETRRTYARENLGKDDASDGEVFFNIGDRFTTEKLRREVEQKVSDFWRKTQTRWAAGREQAGNDQLAYRAMTGEVPWESVKDQLEPKTDINSARGESWYGEGFLGAVETLPAMIESMAEGSRKGVAFAGAGATAAALGGQAGPQAAAPEELITVPSAAIMGYSVGETSGMADYWFRQGAGSLYHELRKEGIPHGVAQKVSEAFGVPYAGIELVQMSKLVPGMKQTVARTVAGAVKQRMLALAREKGVEYVEQIGQETTQEILQIAAEALAEGVAGVRAPEDKRPALGRIWDTITQTMTSMPFLMLPKMATDAVAAARGGGQAARPARAPGLLDVLTPEQQSYVATAPNVEAMLGRYQEILAGKKAEGGEMEKGGALPLRFSKAPGVEEQVGRAWLELAKDERTMVQGATPTETDIGAIVAEIAGPQAEGIKVEPERTPDGHLWGYTFRDEKGHITMSLSDNVKEVEVNSQYAGRFSLAIYQSIYAWAHNNGWKAIEDQAGLSNEAKLRRTSHMLSSALRFGTTRHIEPGPDSGIRGWKEGDSPEVTSHNVGLLAMQEAREVRDRLKELPGIQYDGKTESFYDGEYRIPSQEVQTYLKQRIIRVDPEFAGRVGDRTLRRALATLSAEGAARSGRVVQLVGTDAEAPASLRRIRYSQTAADAGGGAADHRGRPGAAGEESAGLPGEAGSRVSGVPAAQARQWAQDIQTGWGSKLEVEVHENAASIPDEGLRAEVRKEGNVEGFYDPEDGKIHLLADRVPTRAEVERILRHEGFHKVIRGKLRGEYLDILSRAAKSITFEQLEAIRRDYPNATPDVWLEEYLAREGQTNPQSSAWRSFVYEVKRMLRTVFGDAVEFTDADVQAFLSKANRRIENFRERASRQEAGDGELRFSKKPKGPERKSWSEVRKGDRWNSVKKLLPKENVEAPKFPVYGTMDDIVERAVEFLKQNSIVTDWTGRVVYLPYGQSRGSYLDPVKNRAEHIVGYDKEQGTHQRVLDLEKAEMLAAVPETIRNGLARVRQDRSVCYFKRYSSGIVHMVVTSWEGVFLKQEKYDSGLVTQFPVNHKGDGLPGAYVEAIRIPDKK